MKGCKGEIQENQEFQVYKNKYDYLESKKPMIKKH